MHDDGMCFWFNVVNTTMCKRHVAERFPDHEVQSLYSVPDDVREQYRYWNERP